ncbi:MAG: hypothetical protein A2Y12_10020 [Planctomycetes bacterium GWF2_42_9]|nr:MAG: hypothetical protein A2Y12_10020 [Planctomycetes bacterium GWF2_42_9]
MKIVMVFIFAFCVVIFLGNPCNATPYVDYTELVDVPVCIGSAGNSWGEHTAKITRNADGVYVAYSVDSGGQKLWRLRKRIGANNWQQVGEGPLGVLPPNLIWSQTGGYLWLIAWPNNVPHCWLFNGNGTYQTQFDVPGNWYPDSMNYCAMGVSPYGDVFISQSRYEDATIRWETYRQSIPEWFSWTTNTGLRHAYLFAFPIDLYNTEWIANRDVLWTDLGYNQPPGYTTWCYNSIGYWKNGYNYVNLKQAVQRPGTSDYVYCYAIDAYRDTAGRIHILYKYTDWQTPLTMRQMVVQNGTILADVDMPAGLYAYNARIFQNSSGQFYVLTTSSNQWGALYKANNSMGTTFNSPTYLAYGNTATPFAIYLARPRAGTPITNYIDGMMTTNPEGTLLHFRINGL